MSSVTSRTAGDDSSEPSEAAVVDAAVDFTGDSLLSTASSDHCIVCGAELAIDQHYCVECGTRRGKPRFALAQAIAVPSTQVVSSRSGPLSNVSTTLMVILSVLALLVTLGIGVLIGNASASGPKVVVNGASGSSSSTGTSGGGSSGAGTSGSGSSSGGSSSSGSSSSGTTTVGSACKAGSAGCTNGKFSGNFFGNSGSGG